MTVWTCNRLTKHTATGEFRPRLWGDNENEVLVVLYGIGASVADQQDDLWGENYRITPEQQLRAVKEFGVIPTDFLEPEAQRAEREGNWAKLASIETTRENYHKGRLALPQPLLLDPLCKGLYA